MLGKLFELVPNIECDRSAMVGFSNGAITLAVLLSSHDEFILNHFKNFCMIDHGMFHLTDLHKKGSRDCRYLVLVGDKQDFGRELKIQRSKLLQDEMKLLGVNLSCEIMKDTGHEFHEKQMTIVSEWLRKE
jgi:predicted esterase